MTGTIDTRIPSAAADSLAGGVKTRIRLLVLAGMLVEFAFMTLVAAVALILLAIFRRVLRRGRRAGATPSQA